EVDPNIQA
nr:physalaemin-like peptide [Oryctolagus cuniculus]